MKFLSSLMLSILLLEAYPLQCVSASATAPLQLTIQSSSSLSGTAGDYIHVRGMITNTGTSSLQNITTYLSLVDTQAHIPVDLEDWSVEKGLLVGTIAPGQTFPLDWKIHFVKAGTYALTIMAFDPVFMIPAASTLTTFQVASKKNLNPGNILPVAIGVPIILLFLFSVIYFKRERSMKEISSAVSS